MDNSLGATTPVPEVKEKMEKAHIAVDDVEKSESERDIDTKSFESPTVESTDHDGDEEYYLTGAKLHILIVGLGLAVFLMALDMSILVTAIPLITEKFQSTADIGWYMSSYTLSL